MDYYEFYKTCQEAYPNTPGENLDDLMFKVLEEGLNVIGLREKVDALFADDAYLMGGEKPKKRRGAFSNTDHLNDLGLDLIRDEINVVADRYLPGLERDYFGTHLLLMQVQMCRSRVRQPDSKEVLSEHWHIDDFPPYSHKIFVYLTDVDSECGPLLVAKRDGELVLGKCSRTGPNNWQVSTPKRRAGLPLVIADCSVDEVLGSAGKVFVFNQHIWHRRSLPRSRERDVLVLNFRPYTHECRPYFGEHTTPWKRYPPITPEPALIP